MDYKSIIESLLFVSGEPLTVEKIASIINKNSEETKIILEEIKNNFISQNHGLQLINNENQWQMTTVKESMDFINKLQKATFEDDLSPTATEVLAIIAYKGPLTRGEINEIRGVESSYVLRQLFLRGLIERKQHPQKSLVYLYFISLECLKFLGISSLKELPDYQNFNA